MTTPAPIATDAEVSETLRLRSAHVPAHPLRATRVPAVLANEPEFVALAAARDALLAAELRVNREHFELTGRNDRAAAEHAQAAVDSMLHGTPPPPPLSLEPWLWPTHTRPLFEARHQALEATELALLDDQADRWADVLDERSAGLRDKRDRAAATVEKLDADLAPYDTARAKLGTARGARFSEDRHRVVDHRRIYGPGDDDVPRTPAEIQAAFDQSRSNRRRR